MGRQKIVEYYNERYKGSLSDEDCEKLEKIIELNSQKGYYYDLKHIIYCLSDTTVAQIIDEETNENIDESLMVRGNLRNYQTLGVAFMFLAKNCILGDNVGIGKTTQAAGLCRMLGNVAKTNGVPYRVLLLTEKALITQTRAEMIRFTGEYFELLRGEKKYIEKFAQKYPCGEGLPFGVVGTHSLAKNGQFLQWIMSVVTDEDLYDNFFDLLILDESSVVGNSTADITKSIKAIIPYFKRVVFLNATPFESKLDVFYTQLSLIDEKLLPTKKNFQNEYVEMDYTGAYPKPSGKYRNADDFRRRVGYRYFARTRKEQGGQMIDCTSKLVVSPLSQVQNYWKSRTQMAQLLYDCPTAIDDSIAFEEFNVPKLASLRKVLSEDCDEADTILLYVHYKEAQKCISDWLTKQRYSNRVLCGDTKMNEAEDIIRGFKNAEFRVLITNRQKGLNFGDCNYCIFYSFIPNPNKMVQFEGRITRSFDVVNKHIFLLCSEGKEKETLDKVIKQRAQASADFTKADFSCILDLLLEE